MVYKDGSGKSSSTTTSAPSLHELEGTCDYCGEVCDSTQDEMNAINCTFETCPSPMIYHQHCVEIYLKSIRLDKQRKTGFQCPRGNGKASKFDKPCPGRVSKSHPIHARNDNSKKRRKAKLPEPPPVLPPAPAPAKKPPGLPKSDSKKGEKEKAVETKKGASSASTSNGSKPAGKSSASAATSDSSLGSTERSLSNSSSSRSLTGGGGSFGLRKTSGESSGAKGSGHVDQWGEAEDDILPVPRTSPSLADFGYTIASKAKANSAPPPVANPWTTPRTRIAESPPPVVAESGWQGKEQRPPNPWEFVPLPSKGEATRANPAVPGGPKPGQPTLAELLLLRTAADEADADVARTTKTKTKSEKKQQQKAAAKAKDKQNEKDSAPSAALAPATTPVPPPSVNPPPATVQTPASLAPTQPVGHIVVPLEGTLQAEVKVLEPSRNAPPSPPFSQLLPEPRERWGRSWSEACVAVLMDRKREVFAAQLQELGFGEPHASLAVMLYGGNLNACLDWLLRGAPMPAGDAQIALLDVGPELRCMEAVVAADMVTQELLEAVLVASLGDMDLALDLLAGATHPALAAADSRLSSPSGSSSVASGSHPWDSAAQSEDSMFSGFGAPGNGSRPPSAGRGGGENDGGAGGNGVHYGPFSRSFAADVARYNVFAGMANGGTLPTCHGANGQLTAGGVQGVPGPLRGVEDLLLGSHSWQPSLQHLAGESEQPFAAPWRQAPGKGPQGSNSGQDRWTGAAGSPDHLDDSLVSMLLNQLLL